MPGHFPVKGVLFASMVLGTAAAPLTRAALSVADQVVSYNSDPMPYWAGGDFNDPSKALGLPNPNTGDFGGQAWYLTPFNAAYSNADLAGIAPGGSLELHLSSPIATDGYTLGVHTGAGLTNMGGPAALYTTPRNAAVSVSQDGNTWVSLGDVSFDLPTNYYSQGISDPLNAHAPGTQQADFSRPFVGALSDFDNKNWSEILELLDDSAGGAWLDLSHTGLNEVNYVKFNVAAGQTMYLDSVVGVSVPEPATAMLLLLPAAVGLLRRRRGA